MAGVRGLPNLSLPENQQEILLSLVPPGKEFNPEEIDHWEKVSSRLILIHLA